MRVKERKEPLEEKDSKENQDDFSEEIDLISLTCLADHFYLKKVNQDSICSKEREGKGREGKGRE